MAEVEVAARTAYVAEVWKRVKDFGMNLSPVHTLLSVHPFQLIRAATAASSWSPTPASAKAGVKSNRLAR